MATVCDGIRKTQNTLFISSLPVNLFQSNIKIVLQVNISIRAAVFYDIIVVLNYNENSVSEIIIAI